MNCIEHRVIVPARRSVATRIGQTFVDVRLARRTLETESAHAQKGSWLTLTAGRAVPETEIKTWLLSLKQEVIVISKVLKVNDRTWMISLPI